PSIYFPSTLDALDAFPMAPPRRRVRSRLLPPPRSPALTEISVGLTNTPRFCGAQGRPAVSVRKKDRFRGSSEPSVSGAQKPFPGSVREGAGDRLAWCRAFVPRPPIQLLGPVGRACWAYDTAQDRRIDRPFSWPRR